MKKLICFCLFAALIAVVFGAVLPAIAQGPGEAAMERLQTVGATAGLGERSIEEMVGIIINIALGFIGIIMVILFIYGGFLWMTAAGDDKKVSKAKDILTAAVIGLIIVLAAYAIARFVVYALVTATQ